MVLPDLAYQAFLQDVDMIIFFHKIIFRKEIGACLQVYYITDSESGDISIGIPSMKGAQCRTGKGYLSHRVQGSVHCVDGATGLVPGLRGTDTGEDWFYR